MPTITINDLRIHFEASGEGEPVVLVHGSWGDHHTWDGLVPELPDGLRVIRYDRRGHSASERPPGQGSIDEDVADLAGLIETVAGGRAHVVGNSQGAQIALRLASSRPELVRSLAVHEPGLWGLVPEEPAVQSLQASIEPVLRLLEGGAHEDGARLFIDLILGPGAWDGLLSDAQRQAFVANAPTFLDEERDPAAYTIDPTRLAGLPAPLLLSTGEESAEAFHVVVERLAGALPRAERATLAGAGHSPHRTHPAAYAALLTSFWAGSDTLSIIGAGSEE